jgi:hypothetical protein
MAYLNIQSIISSGLGGDKGGVLELDTMAQVNAVFIHG